MSEPVAERKRLGVAKLAVVVVAMFGFGYALVPLYRVVCQITGLNGKSDGISLQSTVTEAPDLERTVKVEFLTNLNSGMDWEFGSEASSVEVHPGQLNTVNFYARNRTEKAMVGQAQPSVLPWNAAKYIRKTECFCFTQQPFDAGEYKDMPVVFMIDPALPKDVTTVTLSYTFFDATELANAGTTN